MWISPSMDADMPLATVAGPLPNGVGLEALVSGNGSHLSDEDIQRLILESPLVLRSSRTSNFDLATQVQRCILFELLKR